AARDHDRSPAARDCGDRLPLPAGTWAGRESRVGVNKYQVDEKQPIETLKINEEAQRRQIERIVRVRDTRDNAKVQDALDELRKTFEDSKANSMYPIVKAVRAYATLGEIMDVGRKVFGDYKEPPIL